MKHIGPILLSLGMVICIVVMTRDLILRPTNQSSQPKVVEEHDRFPVIREAALDNMADPHAAYSLVYAGTSGPKCHNGDGDILHVTLSFRDNDEADGGFLEHWYDFRFDDLKNAREFGQKIIDTANEAECK